MALTLALLLASAVAFQPAPAAGSATVLLVAERADGPADFAAGEPENLALTDAGLQVGDEGLRAPALNGDWPFGLYLSPVLAADRPFDVVAGAVLGDWPADRPPELEVRGQTPDGAWTAWVPVDGAGAALPLPVQLYQYRLTLLDGPGGGPLVRGVHLQLGSTGATYAAAQTPPQNPTVRVFGTREGLVGQRTANGHLIVPFDRFAALPSKRALARDGGNEYQVRISYRGKTATVPVWDVGPWNSKDNYWDAQRELFGDLPRYQPQALAAWLHGYNGGRDQFGRWVTFPASIDIADGTFIQDLGMTQSDWVDVTFLWVTGPQPPPFDPPQVWLKPEPAAAAANGRVWYFAEGSTKPPFQTWLHLQNPNPAAATATVTYLKTDGGQVGQRLTLRANSRASVYVNQVLPDAEFGLRVEADQPVFVERAMYFRRDGHASIGATAPATTWYLAEGSSQDPFETWVLVLNPNAAPATVTLSFMKEDGSVVVHRTLVPATSRASIFANLVVPNAAFSTRVEADRPVVVERAMYLKAEAGGGGHGALAVPAPRQGWYFAEGDTRPEFDTWLLLQNPNPAPANVAVTLLGEDGTPALRSYTVGPQARRSIFLNDELPNARFGLVIAADRPIIAERAMYFGQTPAGRRAGAHVTSGAPAAAKVWYLPEGSTQPPFQEYLLVANPNSAPARATLELVTSEGELVSRPFDLRPTSRLTVDVNALLPGRPLSARVTADQPVVVERSMYLNDGQGGTNTIGIAQP